MSANEKPVDLAVALSHLESWKNESSAIRQRRFKRYPARGQARLLPGAYMDRDTASVMMEIRDISRGGLGMLSSVQMQLGQFWRVQLIENNVVVVTLPAFCRYCRTVVNGAYLAGVEFGVEAGVLLAMGVGAADIIGGDEISERERMDVAGEFVDPKSLLDNDAA
jgi:hypothetical protein